MHSLKILRRGCVPIGLVLLAVFSAQAEEFDSAGVKIHYVVQGKGEPVVLIHGLHSSAQMNWGMEGIIDLLAKDFQVIALDCRGHGQSGKPEAEGEYGVKMVEDVARLLDHLKIGKAQIVGYSMGGMIAVKFIVTHPERTKSAVLGGMGWLKAGSPLEKFWAIIPEREGARTPTACLRGLSQMGVTAEEVKGIKVPVTMIVGTRDPCRKLYVLPMQKLRSDWPVVTISAAGHINCIMKPEFKTQLRDALLKQSATPTQK